MHVRTCVVFCTLSFCYIREISMVHRWDAWYNDDRPTATTVGSHATSLYVNGQVKGTSPSSHESSVSLVTLISLMLLLLTEVHLQKAEDPLPTPSVYNDPSSCQGGIPRQFGTNVQRLRPSPLLSKWCSVWQRLHWSDSAASCSAGT